MEWRVRTVDRRAARARGREGAVEVDRDARGGEPRGDRGDRFRRAALHAARGARVRVAHEAALRVLAPPAVAARRAERAAPRAAQRRLTLAADAAVHPQRRELAAAAAALLVVRGLVRVGATALGARGQGAGRRGQGPGARLRGWGSVVRVGVRVRLHLVTGRAAPFHNVCRPARGRHRGAQLRSVALLDGTQRGE